MPPMKYFNQEKVDLLSTVFSELKSLGVKLPKLKKLKSVYTKQEKFSEEISNKIFGVSLSEQEWILEGELLLPKFVAITTTYLKSFSCSEVGLFRKAGNIARQKKLKAKLENGGSLEGSEPNDVASLLKQWLRELPDSLIPTHLQDLFIRCLQLDDEKDQITACLLTCLVLLPAQLNILKHLLSFMADVASNCDTNKMSTFNLALIMAPNIFAVNEPADKNKNNLIQQCTNVLKLLIENFDKIGEIPPGITFQYPPLNSELDSSGDILDLNKSKKRRKSGGTHVQDIFSGFKKLVGQNGTPSKTGTPEKCLDAPKSAAKRKVESDVQFFNKKQAHSTEDLHNRVNTSTPRLKGIVDNATEKIVQGHVRRKSIGALLRRKDRKRGKSNKSPLGELQLNVSPNYATKSNKDSKKMYNDQLKLEDSMLTQAGSIKKQLSDRHLLDAISESSAYPSLTISSSQGCLPIRALKASPYNLRSAKLSKSWMSEDICLKDLEKSFDRELQLRNTNVANDVRKEVNVKTDISLNNLSPQNIPSKHNLKKFNTFTVENNCKSEINSKEEGSQFLHSPNNSFTNSNLNVQQSEKVSEFSQDPRLKRNLNNDNDSLLEAQKCSMVRQEAFIRKSTKKKAANPNAAVRRSVSSRSELDSSNKLMKKRGSNSNLRNEYRHLRRNGSERKSLRRKTRHGSLMRGKPNSVQSGLPSVLPRGCPNDSSLMLNSPSYSKAARESFLKFCETSILDSPQIPNLDLSLNILLQNFTLSSPAIPPKLSLDIGISTSNNNSTVNVNISQKEEEQTKNQTDLAPGIQTNASESEIKNLSDYDLSFQSLRESNIDSLNINNTSKQNFFNLEESSLAFSDSLCGGFKTPPTWEGKSTENNNQSGKIFDDSCFKTPNNVRGSPDSNSWMSGSTFFNTLPSPQEEIYNKRESIAMILKNNTGHVQAKVNLYDKNVHGDADCGGYPKENFNHPGTRVSKSAQKCFSAGGRIRSSHAYSSVRKCSSANRSKIPKSPLPPPPKFILADINTPSPKVSRPLQELTNINLAAEEPSAKRSPPKYLEHESPFKPFPSPAEMKRNNSDSKLKAKRKSFSGNTPYKISKKVSRSESSPACNRNNVNKTNSFK